VWFFRGNSLTACEQLFLVEGPDGTKASEEQAAQAVINLAAGGLDEVVRTVS